MYNCFCIFFRHTKGHTESNRWAEMNGCCYGNKVHCQAFFFPFPRKTGLSRNFFHNQQTPTWLALHQKHLNTSKTKKKKKKHLNLDLKAGLMHLWKKDRESDTGKQQQERVKDPVSSTGGVFQKLIRQQKYPGNVWSKWETVCPFHNLSTRGCIMATIP